MTAAPNSPLVERVRGALMHSAISLKADEKRGDVHLRGMLAPMAQAALDARRAEELRSMVEKLARQLKAVEPRYSRDEAIIAEAEALLAKLETKP